MGAFWSTHSGILSHIRCYGYFARHPWQQSAGFKEFEMSDRLIMFA